MTERSLEMRNWRRIALLASVILNLFLAALIGSHLLRSHLAKTGSGGWTLVKALANAQAVLSTSDASAFGDVFRRDAANFIGATKDLEDARSELDRKIVADPYDPQAVQAALNAWQTLRDRFLVEIAPTLVDALGQISQDGRRKLVAEQRQGEPSFHAR